MIALYLMKRLDIEISTMAGLTRQESSLNILLIQMLWFTNISLTQKYGTYGNASIWVI